MKKVILFLLFFTGLSAKAQLVGTPYMVSVIKIYPKSCKEILATNAAAPSGTYTIDVDGTGASAPFDCHCDMTTDGGGWTLVAIRNTTSLAMFAETAIAPVLPTSVAGTRLSAIWALTNANFDFTSIRYTDAGASFTSKAIATFPASVTLSSLNTTYSSYSQSPTNATVTTVGIAGSALTKFYFRGKSAAVTPFNDGADYAGFAFSTANPLNAGDSWDTSGAYWILAGHDSGGDPLITTTPSGAIFTNGTINGSGSHWATNNRPKVTYVWLR